MLSFACDWVVLGTTNIATMIKMISFRLVPVNALEIGTVDKWTRLAYVVAYA
jgi:hypothetical protein